MSGSNLPQCPVPTIDQYGIHVPTYEDYYEYVTGCAFALYGADINVDADTQDGQFLGILALSMSDCANSACGSYNNFSPQTAQGVGLSSVVKINGLKRIPAVYSTVNVNINGINGTTITNGIVADELGNQWALPASVTILTGGTIEITATAVNPGAITAAENTITNIVTPTAGWYSCTNPTAAAPGNAGQSDAALRIEQAVSTSIPSQTLVTGLLGALLTLTGVLDAVVYENFTNSTDGNDVPAHSIWCVVQGGTISQIGTTIAVEKSIGCGLKGSTSYVYNPPNGQPALTILYDVPTPQVIVFAITVKALPNYTESVGNEIIAALIAYTQGVSMRVNIIEWDECVIAAKTLVANGVSVAANAADSSTFRIQSLTLCAEGGTPAIGDVTVTAGYKATTAAGNITLTVE